MRYIDFDGVIMDVEDNLFSEWREEPGRYNLPWNNEIRYIKRSDWKNILCESEIINDAINILKKMDVKETAILTKIYSLENEGTAKINYLREHGVKQDVILVPYNLKKTDIVKARGNILVDDSIEELLEWEKMGGYPMFFDREDKDIDDSVKSNNKSYQRVLRIDSKINK